MISWTRVLGAGAALALLVASAADALPFNNLIVFGDSLVDGGNVSIITGGTTPNPAQGYYAGRFSNGPVASDILNQAIEGTNSTASLAGGDNYAYGGARARNDGLSVPDVAAQVSSVFSAAHRVVLGRHRILGLSPSPSPFDGELGSGMGS